ncbi:AIPR family protein [Inediibacterium massiliense]|uniref:AIPR family protein n=1 Tax=Inediibacterium massiliense TaxID=1658111 RepID=UPI0006B5B9B9|nr:AIPR family protein [Inediibacterium massiliense]
MQFEPTIKLKLKAYKEKYELENLGETEVFERFANQTILTSHQPDAFSIETDLIDIISVGGSEDMGIDGIAIKFNGVFITNKTDIQDLMQKNSKDNVEFIFIQSKYKRSFDSKEYGTFITGIKDFLNPQQYLPYNKKIELWLDLKNYILSDEVMVRWESNPSIRIYYIVMGEWNNSPHILARSEQFKEEIAKLHTYDSPNIRYIDSKSFKNICDENENTFTEVLNIIDIFSLTEVNNVDNSSIILCYANEFIKMLMTEDGIIRKTLFIDNVRDYQGDTMINNEIFETIKSDPKSFILLNNGITVVCDTIIPGNRKITIENPRIVNGCQTSNVLYHANCQGINISDIALSIKLIATKSTKIINNVVRGTNKQNIVLDEVFEVTRDFHKELEEFINSMSTCNEQYFEKIYYERRSKQYADNPTIKAIQKINLRLISQDFISIFLFSPHLGHRHESKILDIYKNQVFVDGQSKYPYYITSLLHVEFEKIFKHKKIPKEYYPYKSHLMLITVLLLNGKAPNINKQKQIDQYCSDLFDKMRNTNTFFNATKLAVEKFNDVTKKWINLRGENYKYSIKDNSKFTELLLSQVLSNNDTTEDSLSTYRGTVLNVKADRNGLNYGFISKSPTNIFFHSKDNPTLNMNKILYKDVTYQIQVNPITNQEVAVNVKNIS